MTSTFFRFSNLSTEVLKIDENAYLTGDLVIKDNNNNINFKAYKDGLVWAREVKVNLSVISPNYVFDKCYKLLPLKDDEKYIAVNKHLPAIPSA